MNMFVVSGACSNATVYTPSMSSQKTEQTAEELEEAYLQELKQLEQKEKINVPDVNYKWY